jgi:DNA-directed RNA polymerase specialized sigma24 family protein
MSLFHKEWSFLTEAWKFALVLTGREAAATALVSGALGTISKRADLHEIERTKRVLFSILCREGAKASVVAAPETPAAQAVFFLHQLPEPSRQAITLLCLGAFSGEQLAGLLGKSEPELARYLDEARARLHPHLAPGS